MKTVFSSEMVAHVWAQQTQPHGRNATNSMHFADSVAYSYSTPVANIVDGVALFTSATYSMTTSGKHVPKYRRAALHLPSFVVPDVLASGGRARTEASAARAHAVNAACLVQEYSDVVAQLLRCPADSYRVSDDARVAETLADKAQTARNYASAFRLGAPSIDTSPDYDAIIARRDRILNDPKRAAKQAKAAESRARAEERRQEQRARQRELDRADAATRVAAWLAGESVSLRYGDVDGGALLRVRNGKVETSQGAECPLPDALRALELWRRVMNSTAASMACWRPLTPKLPLGNFTLDGIDADGTVHAGCHTIARLEVERFAAALGA